MSTLETARLSIPLDQIELPPVSSGPRLSQAEKEAWDIFAKETLTGVEVVAEVESETMVAFLHWQRLMADPVFCLMPMNSPEFSKTMAGRLPDNVRRYLVETAGLTWAEAMAMPFKEILILAARRLKQGVESQKPGPEHFKKSDAKGRYFKVWTYLQKPGNSAKSDVQVSELTKVNKDMVARIRKETRPPTDEERKAHTEEQKTRRTKRR